MIYSPVCQCTHSTLLVSRSFRNRRNLLKTSCFKLNLSPTLKCSTYHASQEKAPTQVDHSSVPLACSHHDFHVFLPFYVLQMDVAICPSKHESLYSYACDMTGSSFYTRNTVMVYMLCMYVHVLLILLGRVSGM